jgi:hypothetical protein
MAMVDPRTGRIKKTETVTIDGVAVLPKFDPRKLTYEVRTHGLAWRCFLTWEKRLPRAVCRAKQHAGLRVSVSTSCGGSMFPVDKTYFTQLIPHTSTSAQPKGQHPLYRTSANTIGARKPGVFDVPTSYRPTSQAFSNTFSIGESTNKRTVMFKDNSLSCSVVKSKVHSSLDWGI